jgi:hypothetical protein
MSRSTIRARRVCSLIAVGALTGCTQFNLRSTIINPVRLSVGWGARYVAAMVIRRRMVTVPVECEADRQQAVLGWRAGR